MNTKIRRLGVSSTFIFYSLLFSTRFDSKVIVRRMNIYMMVCPFYTFLAVTWFKRGHVMLNWGHVVPNMASHESLIEF